jgi:signal peptidase
MKPLKIIYYIFVAFIGIIVLLLIVSAFPITGNYKLMIVQSGSMEPAIKMGSIVMVKPVDDYRIGDVISFGEVTRIKAPTTHRIYDIKVAEGQPVYITKGDANNAPDQREIPKSEVIGKVLISLPYLGYAVDFAKKPIGFALIILVPAAIIIGDEIKKIIGELGKKKKTNAT